MLAFLDKGKRQRHNQCIELRGPERDDNIDALFYLNSVQVWKWWSYVFVFPSSFGENKYTVFANADALPTFHNTHIKITILAKWEWKIIALIFDVVILNFCQI